MKVLEGIVVNSSQTKRQQVFFDESTGLITAVKDPLLPRRDVDYWYNDECLVFPGFIDIHVHAREDVSAQDNYKEDYTSMSQAALNGGVTAVADMPNNPLPPIDEPSYLAKLALTAKSQIPVLPYAGIGPDTVPLSFDVPYKVFMTRSVGDLYFKNKEQLEKVVARYQGKTVSFHCEDASIIEQKKSELHHHLRRPIEAEVEAVKTIIDLTQRYKLMTNICHLSSKEALNLVLQAKARKLSIKFECAPHHLFFSQEMLPVQNKKMYRTNPPIRYTSDVQALIAALGMDLVDFLATDHAPHLLVEKLQGVSGLIGLDTYGAFVSWLLLHHHIDPRVIAKCACENPGEFMNRFLRSDSSIFQNLSDYGLGFGYILPKYLASMTVLDLHSSVLINQNLIKSKGLWSPFEGIRFPGRVQQCFFRGAPVK